MEEEQIVYYKKSVIPYYIIGFLWIVYGILFPLYRLLDFFILSILSTLVFLLANAVFPPKKEITVQMKSTGNVALDEELSIGKEFVSFLDQSAMKVEQEAVQEKMLKLQKSSKAIYEEISVHPEKLSEARRFLNYYVPTARKLIASYLQLKEQKIATQNIVSTMEGIEKALSQICVAFENQVDALFQKQAIDIASDIKVLEFMMQREGLLYSDFDTLKATAIKESRKI